MHKSMARSLLNIEVNALRREQRYRYVPAGEIESRQESFGGWKFSLVQVECEALASQTKVCAPTSNR